MSQEQMNLTDAQEDVSDLEKECCAVTTLRRMIEKYSEKHAVPFETAFFQFTNTCVYEALFDYETGIWHHGPDYIMALFEEALKETN